MEREATHSQLYTYVCLLSPLVAALSCLSELASPPDPSQARAEAPREESATATNHVGRHSGTREKRNSRVRVCQELKQVILKQQRVKRRSSGARPFGYSRYPIATHALPTARQHRQQTLLLQAPSLLPHTGSTPSSQGTTR